MHPLRSNMPFENIPTMNQASFNVTLSVNDEQMKAIENLFTKNGWELKKNENKKRRLKTTDRRSAHLPIVDQLEVEENIHSHTSKDNSSECNECFLDPCVTLRPNNWIGRGQQASHHNGLIRKELYGKWWKCLSNQGAWNDRRYLTKKRCIGGGDTIVYHKREIMPDCVLKKMRDMYPNPIGVNYMGHQWQ